MLTMKGHNTLPIAPKIPGTDLRSPDVPTAMIYRPSRSVTQSGRRPRHWILEFEPCRTPTLDPLMGWATRANPYRTVRLTFPDKESAIGFAEKQVWTYMVRGDARNHEGEFSPAQHEHIVGGANRAAPRPLQAMRPTAEGRQRIASDTSGLTRIRRTDLAADPVEEASLSSFPASDPPAWTGSAIYAR